MTVEKTLVITNAKGLHARAAAAFVKTADRFDAEVTVSKNGESVSGHSIMGLMMLGAAYGSDILVSCTGTQAAEALSALEKLVDDKFNEN
ncbi:MAG TPA: HPr family phosphocarrier protein [Alphaproteobacteria bacterium]|nr:HPr family phosphocarrier protein [Alphaproteobacteria bacterium]